MKDKDTSDFVEKLRVQTEFILNNVSSLKQFSEDALKTAFKDMNGSSKEMKEARKIAAEKMEELKIKHAELIDKINSFKK